jgi:hypothetical protein
MNCEEKFGNLLPHPITAPEREWAEYWCGLDFSSDEIFEGWLVWLRHRDLAHLLTKISPPLERDVLDIVLSDAKTMAWVDIKASIQAAIDTRNANSAPRPKVKIK